MIRTSAIQFGAILSVALLGACSTVEKAWDDGARTTRTAATEVHGAVVRQDAYSSLDAVGRAEDWDDAMLVPAKDLNIRKADVPPILLTVEDPYAPAPRTCGELRAHLAGLDAALGPDYGDEKPEESKMEKGGIRLVASAVGDLIPFRSVVREVSGSAKRERRIREHYRIGNVRRGYLQGVARERGCR